MNHKLIKANEILEKELYDFIKEWEVFGENIIPASIQINDLSYNEWLDYNKKIEKKENCTKDIVTASNYFLVSNNRIIGGINIRHSLNEYLKKYGGHIGYGIRPTERKKGYAVLMLSLALSIIKDIGVNKVLITCNKNNIYSAKTIIKCGGILENETLKEDKVLQRYWIDV